MTWRPLSLSYNLVVICLAEGLNLNPSRDVSLTGEAIECSVRLHSAESDVSKKLSKGLVGVHVKMDDCCKDDESERSETSPTFHSLAKTFQPAPKLFL